MTAIYIAFSRTSQRLTRIIILIPENYRFSGLEFESSRNKENIFRLSVFWTKKYLLQLSLSEEGTVQNRLFISNNQSGDVRRTLVTSDMFIVPKYRS